MLVFDVGVYTGVGFLLVGYIKRLGAILRVVWAVGSLGPHLSVGFLVFLGLFCFALLPI